MYISYKFILLLIIIIITIFIIINNEKYSNNNLIVSKLSKYGLYAMVRCILNQYLYCKKNKINFKLDSSEWLYKINDGWTDYFENIELNFEYTYYDGYITEFDKIDRNSIKLVNYESHPEIKAPLSN